MDFSLEDLDIEVTKNDENTDMDVAAADSEATISIDNVIRIGNKIATVINNVVEMCDHIRKFKITKPMLHLHNKKNALGRAAKVTLPSFESDDQWDGVDETDYDANDVVAGLEGMLSDAKNKVVEWFKKMIETIKNFFKVRWGSAARLEKRLNALKAKLKGNPNWDKIGSMEMETYKFDEMMNAIGGLSAAFAELGTIKVEDGADFGEAKIKKINDGLKFVGYKIVEDDKEQKDGHDIITYKIEEATDDKLEKAKEKLDTLKWSVGGMEKQIDGLKVVIKKVAKGDSLISTLNKAQAKATKAGDKTANDAANSYEKTKDESEHSDSDDKKAAAAALLDSKKANKELTAADSSNLINRANVIIKSVTKITDAIFNLVAVFCAIGEKIPMKGK